MLGMCRASLLYRSRPMNGRDEVMLNEIDDIFTSCPFYGSRRIRQELMRRGHAVNRKKIRRMMRLLGIQAIYPKKSLSRRNPEHKTYPYLLRDVEITRRDQVWSMDITYIRLRGGHVYLTAIIDWHTRYVLAWALSTTLDGGFCCETLREALKRGTPEVFNTDQGCQFTAKEFVEILEKRHIQISMDGRGRALDNVFVERLWRSVKYEEVYIKDYETVRECRESLRSYFRFYNERRLHQSLNYETPAERYYITHMEDAA